MCADPGTVMAIGSALAGTYLQQQTADAAANKQQKIINNAADENLRLQTKKADTITDFAKETFDPATRDKRYEDAATKNESTLKDALLSAQGGEGQVYQGTEGNLSSDYTRGKAQATANATQDIMNRTKLLARSNANGHMYEKESVLGGMLSTDLAGINAAGKRNDNAANAALSNVRDEGSVLGGLLVTGAPAIGDYLGNYAGNAYNAKIRGTGMLQW